MAPELEPICILDDDASVRHSIQQLVDSDGLTALSFENVEAFFTHARVQLARYSLNSSVLPPPRLPYAVLVQTMKRSLFNDSLLLLIGCLRSATVE